MKIKRKVKKHKDLERSKPCILCGELTMGRGVFVPDDPQVFGAPDRQKGGFVYPLCPACHSLPHEKIFPLVEQVIFSVMKARTAELN